MYANRPQAMSVNTLSDTLTMHTVYWQAASQAGHIDFLNPRRYKRPYPKLFSVPHMQRFKNDSRATQEHFNNLAESRRHLTSFILPQQIQHSHILSELTDTMPWLMDPAIESDDGELEDRTIACLEILPMVHKGRLLHGNILRSMRQPRPSQRRIRNLGQIRIPRPTYLHHERRGSAQQGHYCLHRTQRHILARTNR